MPTRSIRSFVFILLVLSLLAFAAAACGGNRGSSDESAGAESSPAPSSNRQVPTMPAARFAAPTSMINSTKVAESPSTPEPGEPDVEFGATTYARLCAECHGEAGEGVADKGKAVTAMQSEAELDDLLRTGGGFGPEHLFGPDKISPDGIMALHAFMQTLPTP